MPTATKLDLSKEHKQEYAASQKPALMTMKPATYLMITGEGAPGGRAFTDAIGALYGVAFTIKMTRKFAGKQDYAVGKLEAIWPDPNCDGEPIDKDQWTWQLMIRTPKAVSQKDLDQAVATLLKRGKGEHARRVELRSLAEGVCVQALHVGPYEEEHKTLAVMQAFGEKKGFAAARGHHEIYLSDPRRVEPAKLKTILRMQVKQVTP